jgi:hypothetical protein
MSAGRQPGGDAWNTEDGSTDEIGPGDAYVTEPGRDAWGIGSEPFVGYEFDSQAAETYAQN